MRNYECSDCGWWTGATGLHVEPCPACLASGVVQGLAKIPERWRANLGANFIAAGLAAGCAFLMVQRDAAELLTLDGVDLMRQRLADMASVGPDPELP